jgi:hypothetical protein
MEGLRLLLTKASLKARAWLDTALGFAHGHAKRMKEPVDWRPSEPEKPAYHSDGHGNHTVRARQQITALRAADASGREWTILEIIPIEPVQGYDRLRMEYGRPRFELKDGTPVVQRSAAVFEVSGTTLTIKSAD